MGLEPCRLTYVEATYSKIHFGDLQKKQITDVFLKEKTNSSEKIRGMFQRIASGKLRIPSDVCQPWVCHIRGPPIHQSLVWGFLSVEESE